MNVFQNCSDTSDATPLSTSQSLYLKPVARLNISVQLPSLKLPGKSISNWEVMEKLRYYAAPEDFTSLKVSKSTLEVVRFEGEIENRSKLKAVLARLDGRSIKLSGFHESLKVRAAEAKPDFPSRHSWDSYFRDAKNMNEMKPGERPDTIHITNLPCRWFATKSDDSKPSEYILRKVFEAFGEIRCVDIPMLDPFRSQMKPHISGIKMFSNNQNMIFEAYIQFKEYICFVKTMDTLRDMKLLHIDGNGKAFSASIKVDFDKTKHLSDSSIRRRRFEREKLMSKEREREEKERKAREEVERKHAEERKRLEEEKAAKLERQRQREERRKAKQLERLKHREADEMNKKIATEERLLLMAQRRLESFRLLGELFNRLKVTKEKERDKFKGETSYTKHRDRHKNKPPELYEGLDMKEKELREKLVKKFKHNEKINQTKTTRETLNRREDDGADVSESDYTYDYNCDVSEVRNFQRGRSRGCWGGRSSRRRRGNMPFRGNMSFRGNRFPTMPFQTFHNRKPFFPQKEPRWAHFPTRARGAGDAGFVPPPFIDPYYLEAAINDPYYKYFQKITLGDQSPLSRSSSRSYSRSYSRSRSRSYSRSHSSKSRSRSRSQTRRRSRSYSRSKSRTRKKSRSRKNSSSHHGSHSSRKLTVTNEKKSEENVQDEKQNQIVSTEANCSDKPPSMHTWSRSPSLSRSLSWEKRKDEPSSKISHCNHKKEKKKKDKKLKKKKKKYDTD